MIVKEGPDLSDQWRYAEIDGEKFVRVSTVLGCINKPSLARWRGRVGNDEADRVSKVATDFGTRLHAALERVNQAAYLPTDYLDQPDLYPHVETYREWFMDNVARLVACERRVVSREHRYAGTCDCLVELRTGELALLDYKSSKNGAWQPDHASWALQLAAYRLALAEDGLIARRRIVLQLPSNEPGRIIEHEYRHHKRDTLAWLAALNLWTWLNGWEKP